jgi:hypothetical protein
MSRNEEMLKLFNQGWSGDQLAERYGITRQRVYQIINRFRQEDRAVRAPAPGGWARMTPEQRSANAKKASRTRYPEHEELRAAVSGLRSLGMGSRRVAKCLQISVGQAAGLIYRLEHA